MVRRSHPRIRRGSYARPVLDYARPGISCGAHPSAALEAPQRWSADGSDFAGVGLLRCDLTRNFGGEEREDGRHLSGCSRDVLTAECRWL